MLEILICMREVAYFHVLLHCLLVVLLPNGTGRYLPGLAQGYAQGRGKGTTTFRTRTKPHDTLEVRRQGKLGEQGHVPDVEGVWFELVRNVRSIFSLPSLG